MIMAGDETKVRLQSAALALFVERGIAETTTRLLAQKAGVAEGTIYRHFASKEDLVRDLFAHHYTAFAADLREVETATRAGIDMKLYAMVRFICALYDSDPVLYRFLLLAQYQAAPIIQSVPNGPAAIFRALIEQGIKAGQIPPQNAPVAAAMLIGVIVQPAMGLIYGSFTGRLSDFAPQIEAACVAVLRAQAKSAGKKR
jgi:AcrR family transcriptional regulator